jgi:hypothetical protein
MTSLQPQESNPVGWRPDRKVVAVVIVSIVLALMLLLHVEWMNGPSYWEWPWRRTSASRHYLAMLVALVPLIGAQVLFHRRRRAHVAGPLALLMLSMFFFEIASVAFLRPSFGLDKIVRVVRGKITTSFFTAAATLDGVRSALSNYPERMADFPMHARVKPPGPVLFFLPFVKSFDDPNDAAIAAGLSIGILSTLSIPAAFLLISTLSGSRQAGFLGASFLAMCPGPVLVYPSMNQLDPIITCGLVLAWVLALERNSWRYSLAFGFVLSLVPFMTYNLLTLGAFLALYALWFACRNFRAHAVRVVIHMAIGVAVVAAFYLGLWLWAGFDSIGSYKFAQQEAIDVWDELHHGNISEESIPAGPTPEMQRPWKKAIFFDLLDFAMSTGWISYLLVGYFFARKLSTDADRTEPLFVRPNVRRAISWMVVLQVLIVDLTGLLRTETARQFIFMTPLLMYPIGLELERWRYEARLVVYGCLWLLMTVVSQNMMFLR